MNLRLPVLSASFLFLGGAISLSILYGMGRLDPPPKATPIEYSADDGLSAEIMPIIFMPEDQPTMGSFQALMDILKFCGRGSRIAICGTGSYASHGYIVTFAECEEGRAMPMNGREFSVFCTEKGKL